MPYITIPVEYQPYQISIDDILNGITEADFARATNDTHDTRTVFRETTPPRLLEKFSIDEMIFLLEDFNRKHKNLIDVEDKTTLYRSFQIPKRTGGYRPIDAPNDELMTALRDLKTLLEKRLFASYHTCAFAYIKKRCTVDDVRRHQSNESKWFLKLDFHNFFGSTTPDFLFAQIGMIFPFSEILKSERGRNALKDALSLCFLRGGLPQGTPISPTLTNLMMIPIDHSISKMCHENVPHLCYTRYADDIHISSQLSFEGDAIRRVMNHSDLQNAVKTIKKGEKLVVYEVSRDQGVVCCTDNQKKANDTAAEVGGTVSTREVTYYTKEKYAEALERLIVRDEAKTNVVVKVLDILKKFNAPFTLSSHKTRYGSSAGRNWNLGVMLNKDNQITIGYQRKKRLKAAIYSFLTDYKNGVQWEVTDVQVLQGNIAYARMVEKERIDEIVAAYNTKFGLDLATIIKELLSS